MRKTLRGPSYPWWFKVALAHGDYLAQWSLLPSTVIL
jgi:hypothetical protein